MSDLKCLSSIDRTGPLLLSVVVPTHGRPLSLQETLDSLSRQNFPAEKLEILVVSNLADVTLDAELKKRNGPIVLHIAGRLGVNIARNLGLRKAQAPIALYLDDDCALTDPGYLSRVLRLHEEFPEAVALGGGYLSPPGLNNTGIHYNWISNDWLGAHFTEPRETTSLVGGAVAYKVKMLLERELFFDESIRYGGAETELHERLLVHGLRLVFHPRLSVVHRPAMNSWDLMRKAYLQGFGKGRRPHIEKPCKTPNFWNTLLKNTVYMDLYRRSFALGESVGSQTTGDPTPPWFRFLLIYLGQSSQPQYVRLNFQGAYKIIRGIYRGVHDFYWHLYHWAWKATELFWIVSEGYWIFYRLATRAWGSLRRFKGQIKMRAVILYWTLYPIFENFAVNWRRPKTFRQVKMPLNHPNIEPRRAPLWIGAFDRGWTVQERDLFLNAYSRLGIGAVEIRDESHLREIEAHGLGRYISIRPFLPFDFSQVSKTAEKVVDILVSEINCKPGPLSEWLKALDMDVSLNFRIDSRLDSRAARVFFGRLKRLSGLKEVSYEMPRPPDTMVETGFEYFRNLHRFDALTHPYKLSWRPLYRYDGNTRPLYQLLGDRVHVPGFAAAADAPRVSVVIPHHRDFGNLRAVLTCLRRQSLSTSDFEVIVVDNATPENLLCEKQCESLFAENASLRFSLISLRSASSTHFLSGHARTQGLLRSRGGAVLFLDSDILVRENFLEVLLKDLQNADVVMAKRQMLNAEFNVRKLELEQVPPAHMYAEEDYWENCKKAAAWTDLPDYWKYSCTYCLAVKRTDMSRAGPFDPHFSVYGFEDVDLGFRLFKLGLRFAFADSTVFHLFPQKGVHNYHHDSEKREQALKRSALTFFLLRPERLPFSICQGYFAPTLPNWLRSPFYGLATKVWRPRRTMKVKTEVARLNA